MAELTSVTSAEAGWKAVFASGTDDESQSRIVAWGVNGQGEVVGLIVDPEDRRRIVAASDVTLADGSAFSAYAFRPAE